MRCKDLTGMVIGRLTVTSNTYVGGTRGDLRYWTCVCYCGNTKDIPHCALVRKVPTKSCGCLVVDHAKIVIKKAQQARIKHNMTKKPEYRAWYKMKERCSPNAKPMDKAAYFDRGIGVCEQWVNDFLAFYAELGDRPTPKHSVDRINNDK